MTLQQHVCHLYHLHSVIGPKYQKHLERFFTNHLLFWEVEGKFHSNYPIQQDRRLEKYLRLLMPLYNMKSIVTVDSHHTQENLVSSIISHELKLLFVIQYLFWQASDQLRKVDTEMILEIFSRTYKKKTVLVNLKNRKNHNFIRQYRLNCPKIKIILNHTKPGIKIIFQKYRYFNIINVY